jgi:SAM-dependent methyltransferase
MVRLDLGCGSNKPPNFIGIDRYAMPRVDILADLESLPFASDSVDLILASHSLEHVSNLLSVMKEIHRICKHGAQVVIVAPYGQQTLNLANPYHKQVFNEHTPRFWTTSESSPLDPREYHHPHAGKWGLADSDHSLQGIDFRCLRMEFFYFPEYRNLSPEEQRAARKKYLNVCDQIMYHLAVAKHPMTDAEVRETAKRIEYYEPPQVTVRKLREYCESLETELRNVTAVLKSRDTELEQTRAVLKSRDTELEQTRAVLKSRDTELEQTRAVLKSRDTELEHLRSELAALRGNRAIRWLDRMFHLTG